MNIDHTTPLTEEEINLVKSIYKTEVINGELFIKILCEGDVLVYTKPIRGYDFNTNNTAREVEIINPRMTILDMSSMEQDVFSLYDRGITILDPTRQQN